LNKLVKYLRLPIPFPDFLGSEDSVQPSRGVLETTTIPHSIPTDLAVSRPHDVFEQLPIPADLDFSAHFFPARIRIQGIQLLRLWGPVTRSLT
jgi:hypothetical protein